MFGPTRRKKKKFFWSFCKDHMNGPSHCWKEKEEGNEKKGGEHEYLVAVVSRARLSAETSLFFVSFGSFFFCARKSWTLWGLFFFSFALRTGCDGRL